MYNTMLLQPEYQGFVFSATHSINYTRKRHSGTVGSESGDVPADSSCTTKKETLE